VVWDYDDPGDRHAIEVVDVECDNPPEGAILVERGCRTSSATLDALFEPEVPLDDVSVLPPECVSDMEGGQFRSAESPRRSAGPI